MWTSCQSAFRYGCQFDFAVSPLENVPTLPLRASSLWQSSSSSSAFPAISLGFTILGQIFAYVTLFFSSNHWGSHIQSLWMVHVGYVFIASIHPSRTWMSGSFESVRGNACVHRLDLGLYSHPKEFLGNGVRTHVNSKGKIPSTRSSAEDWTHDTASYRTASSTHLWRSCSGPYCITQDSQPNTLPTELFRPLLHHTGQPAQHTTDWAVPAPTASHRTASPTHRTASPTHYW